MEQFASNAFLLNSFNFIVLLVILTFVLHLILVIPSFMTKITWKKIDYVWLVFACIGLIGSAVSVRVSTAKNWVEIDKRYSISSIDMIRYALVNPDQQYACFSSKFNYLDSIEKQQYTLACKWTYIMHEYFQRLNENDVPELKINHGLLNVKYKFDILNEKPEYIKKIIDGYSLRRNRYIKTLEATSISSWENFLIYLSPFLLCIALALRITKVSGELKLEKNNK